MGIFSFGQPRRSWGMILLAVWLILTGLQAFTTIPIDSLPKILSGLAIASGVLILLNR
jgi:hypothetical protein